MLDTLSPPPASPCRQGDYQIDVSSSSHSEKVERYSEPGPSPGVHSCVCGVVWCGVGGCVCVGGPTLQL